MHIKPFFIIATFALLYGCADIAYYETLEQPTETAMKARIGGQIFRVTRKSDLPNVIGKADIWGGKVDRGYMELRYAGVTEDGRVALRITEVETSSNESTMSRYGRGQSTMNATTTFSPIGTAHTTGSGYYIPPPAGSTRHLPPNTTEFMVDPARKKTIELDCINVELIDASPEALAYRLTKNYRC